MATVREKAAALNLSAFQSPVQRPPGRCRGPGPETVGATGRVGDAGCGSHPGGDPAGLQPGLQRPPRAPALLWLPQLEETPETPPSSRAEGLLFLHGLESNPGSSLQTDPK